MKPKRILIVDGYNVLNAWRPANGMDSSTLSDARDRLASRLMDYAGFSGQRVVLVYDAWQTGSAKRSEEQMGPLTVVYTKKNETADHYVERLCDQFAHRAELGQVEIRVATSDLVEQMVVLGRHATRLSARELLLEQWADGKSAKTLQTELAKTGLTASYAQLAEAARAGA